MSVNSKRVSIVTGSSKGIGFAIAEEFARANYCVVMNARDETELAHAAEELKKITGNNDIRHLAADVSRDNACQSLVNYAVDEFGRIDVLVNNAGIGGSKKDVSDTPSDEWDYIMDVNLKGTFLCTREAIKNMRQGDGNSIINISSVHESVPWPQGAPYAASKGGMEMLTRTVALELADKGIRVNSIAPGAIATDMNKEILEDPEKRKKEEEKIPMHRIGEPSEIAKIALFLASEDSSYITGATIYADGGLALST